MRGELQANGSYLVNPEPDPSRFQFAAWSSGCRGSLQLVQNFSEWLGRSFNGTTIGNGGGDVEYENPSYNLFCWTRDVNEWIGDPVEAAQAEDWKYRRPENRGDDDRQGGGLPDRPRRVMLDLGQVYAGNPFYKVDTQQYPDVTLDEHGLRAHAKSATDVPSYWFASGIYVRSFQLTNVFSDSVVWQFESGDYTQLLPLAERGWQVEFSYANGQLRTDGVSAQPLVSLYNVGEGRTGRLTGVIFNEEIGFFYQNWVPVP